MIPLILTLLAITIPELDSLEGLLYVTAYDDICEPPIGLNVDAKTIVNRALSQYADEEFYLAAEHIQREMDQSSIRSFCETLETIFPPNVMENINEAPMKMFASSMSHKR